MYTVRAARYLRPNPIFTTTSSTSIRFASDIQKTRVDGASDKSQAKAQPKILSENPPLEESEQSEDVRKHNEGMDKRAERPAEKASKEDVKNDKVGKGFWGGEPGAGGEKGKQGWSDK
ncbi:hypothetical protein LTR09_008634 [Extremus antarcticus]|uniref:Uncharacterized protein n=1 Tax=Extremus antarcticus TaxID=702011 RepID=A0AAJ0DAF5_9PEZI|nr:hypothetical protein LTR09_008634 [Extremus antarcticus]